MSSIRYLNKTFVYGIQSGLFIKVGFAKDLRSRLSAFELHNPHPCRVVAKGAINDGLARAAEMRAHKILENYAIGREWFTIDVELARSAIRQAIKETKAAHLKYMKDSYVMAARVRDAGRKKELCK